MTIQDENEQARIIAFLSNGATQISTHGARIFLRGDRAIKLKRSVKYPFMDFSTPERRRRALEAEFVLNAPGAPDLYLSVAPICETNGHITIGGTTKPLDWVLIMRRFDQTELLSEMARTAGISAGVIESLANTIVKAHRSCPPVHRPEADYFERTTLDNIASLRDAHCPGADLLEERLRQGLERMRNHLETRARRGFVRRGHGDLHLGNIVMVNGKPTPFDALEFDDALATGDVFYDLAFLLMDLEHHGLRPLANLLLNRYVWLSRDIAGLKALALFIAARAAVRAKVSVLRGSVEEAQSYVACAMQALAPADPRVVAVGGFSGVGKSAVAREVAPWLAPAPGAICLRTDLVRKRHYGVADDQRLPAEAYTPRINREVYNDMMLLCRSVLDCGYSVLLDAVFSNVDERNRIAMVAKEADVPFEGIWLEVPLAIRLERLATRIGDASDADAAVARAQESYAVGNINWPRVEASDTLGHTVSRVMKTLSVAMTS